MKTKPQLGKQAFWDVDFEKLDYEKNAGFIIERIFSRGTLDEILEVISFYGEEKVKEVLTAVRHLSLGTLHLASHLLNIPKERFACFTKMQSQKFVYPF